MKLPLITFPIVCIAIIAGYFVACWLIYVAASAAVRCEWALDTALLVSVAATITFYIHKKRGIGGL